MSTGKGTKSWLGAEILLPPTLLGDTRRVTIAGYASGSPFINRDGDTAVLCGPVTVKLLIRTTPGSN